MKVKQISDSTLKITILLDDLEERGMEIADFLIPQEKTEDFFYTVLDELDLPNHFKESGMLSFRVTPKPDRVDIFVTKSEIDQQLDFEDLADLSNLDDVSRLSPEQLFKTFEDSLRSKSAADSAAVNFLEEVDNLDAEEEEEDRRYIYYILEFDDFQQLHQFSQTVDFDIEESELYKMDGRYYMTVLIHVEHKVRNYPEYVLARMLEHSKDSNLTRAVLQEHGYLLLPQAALATVRKV